MRFLILVVGLSLFAVTAQAQYGRRGPPAHGQWQARPQHWNGYHRPHRPHYPHHPHHRPYPRPVYPPPVVQPQPLPPPIEQPLPVEELPPPIEQGYGADFYYCPQVYCEQMPPPVLPYPGGPMRPVPVPGGGGFGIGAECVVRPIGRGWADLVQNNSRVLFRGPVQQAYYMLEYYRSNYVCR